MSNQRRGWSNGADWEPWMSLAGRTTFNLLGGRSAAPELLPGDRALALAQGTTDPLGRALAMAIVTMSTIGWHDVLRVGEQRLSQMLANDRRLSALLKDARAPVRIRIVLVHAFLDIALAQEWPYYRRAARVARMRLANYIALYQATRGWLQTLADDANVEGNNQLARCA